MSEAWGDPIQTWLRILDVFMLLSDGTLYIKSLRCFLYKLFFMISDLDHQTNKICVFI